jgi:hypothetical protein
MSIKLEKKVKALNLKDQAKTKEIATLKDQVKTLNANQQNFVKALQQWESMNKSQAQIVHSMAIFSNLVMDKLDITSEDLAAKSAEMQEKRKDLEGNKYSDGQNPEAVVTEPTPKTETSKPETENA